MSGAPLTSGGMDPPNNGGGDPYFVFRNELLRKLELVDEQLAELERVIQQEDNTKLRNVKKSLKKSIKDASLTYNDLDTCVQLSSGSSQLPPNELYERQCFSKACQDRLNQAKQRVTSTATTTLSSSATASPKSHYNMLSTNGEADGPGSNTNNSHLSNGSNQHNNSYTNHQRESLLLHQHRQHQDETLDQLDAAVSRVGTMAENIHEEIGQQGKMLDEMESDLIEAEEQLGVVMGKLSDFLGTKDRFQLCTIAILFITAIVLLLLVLYT